MSDIKPQKIRSPYLRYLMVLGGILSVALGAIGIVLPILPTTPFFLLAAYLFVRSSTRLYRWLLTHRIFGNYIRNYIQNKSISKGVKIFTLALLWSTILLSVYLTSHIPWVQILLIIIAIAVSIHILSLNTTRNEPNNGKPKRYEKIDW
ncbi:MAG: YbaN family protein [Tenuifilaceae bacterium]|nr:YbaN family protein [Tenuifilaceae bacterium]